MMVDTACINLEVVGGDVWTGDAIVPGATNHLQQAVLDVGNVHGWDLCGRRQSTLPELLACHQNQTVTIAAQSRN